MTGSGKRGQILKEDVRGRAEAKAPADEPAPAPRAVRRIIAAGTRPRPHARTDAPVPPSVGAQRRGTRGARAHDAAAPDHRAAPQGRAEHRRHPDDVQRRRHERGDEVAQRIQGDVREAPRREAGLHGLLREGLPAGAEGGSRGQRRDRRRRDRLQELLPHRRRRRHRPRPRRAGGARGRPHEPRRDRDAGDGFRQAGARRQARHRGHAGRHLHHHQRRRLRLAHVDANSQCASIGYPRHAPHRGASRGARRPGRGTADDVPRPQLRPPYRRRPEAVAFLVRVKECLEDPQRFLLEL